MDEAGLGLCVGSEATLNGVKVPPDGLLGGFHGTHLHPSDVFEKGFLSKGSNWELLEHIQPLDAVENPEDLNEQQTHYRSVLEADLDSLSERSSGSWVRFYGISAFRGTTPQIAYPSGKGAIAFSRHQFASMFGSETRGWLYEICNVPCWDVTQQIRSLEAGRASLDSIVQAEREQVIPSTVPREHIRKVGEVVWSISPFCETPVPIIVAWYTNPHYDSRFDARCPEMAFDLVRKTAELFCAFCTHQDLLYLDHNDVERGLRPYVREGLALELTLHLYSVYCVKLGCDLEKGWDVSMWHRVCVEFGFCDVLAIHTREVGETTLRSRCG